jgi:hypothetical protein
MFRRFTPTLVAAAVLAIAACGGEESSPSPTAPQPTLPTALAVSPETSRLEGVARRLARALGDPAFRARIYARLQASQFPEGKIQLQRTFAGAANRGDLRSLARLNGESETTTDSAVRNTRALEVYLPVPAHRAAWKGDSKLLVATAANDGEVPVAFDLQGGRHLLNPATPPKTPVLAVVPVETNFDLPPVRAAVSCDATPTCPGGGQSGGGSNLKTNPGLYMTKAHFNQDFEGWLKGSPEFEIHVMGQKGKTDSLIKYACAGEHQVPLYNWDGGTNWSGSVMIFDQNALNAYHSAHPGETFRIVAMEDDDTSCEMKVDSGRWATFVASIGPLYKDVTGAIDTGSVKKYVSAGKSLQKFLAALAGVIKTNDDLIGNAMEDKVVGEYHAGYNWILRADNNKTNGYINLEMR